MEGIGDLVWIGSEEVLERTLGVLRYPGLGGAVAHEVAAATGRSFDLWVLDSQGEPWCEFCLGAFVSLVLERRQDLGLLGLGGGPFGFAPHHGCGLAGSGSKLSRDEGGGSLVDGSAEQIGCGVSLEGVDRFVEDRDLEGLRVVEAAEVEQNPGSGAERIGAEASGVGSVWLAEEDVVHGRGSRYRFERAAAALGEGEDLSGEVAALAEGPGFSWGGTGEELFREGEEIHSFADGFLEDETVASEAAGDAEGLGGGIASFCGVQEVVEVQIEAHDLGAFAVEFSPSEAGSAALGYEGVPCLVEIAIDGEGVEQAAASFPAKRTTRPSLSGSSATQRTPTPLGRSSPR